MPKSNSIKEDIEERLSTLTQEEYDIVINNLLGMINNCRDTYKTFLPFCMNFPVTKDNGINSGDFIIITAKNDFSKVINKIHNDPYEKYHIIGRIFSMDEIAEKMASIISITIDLQLDIKDKETLSKVFKASRYPLNIYEPHIDERTSHNLECIKNLVHEVKSNINRMVEKLDCALSSDFNYNSYSDYYTELVEIAKKKSPEDITILQELLIYIKSFYYTLATCEYNMLLFNIETII